MQDLATALALVLVIEGALYSLFPEVMRRVGIQVAGLPLPVVRFTGLVAACLGVAVVWLIRR